MLVWGVLRPSPAAGDGGLVRATESSGPFVITVLTSPTPLRAGPADVSVMVQHRDTSAPVLDARVSLVLGRRDDAGAPIAVAVTRAQATNKLLYAAPVEVPAAGVWDAAVSVERGDDRARVGVALDVETARPGGWAVWPYLALPPAAVAVFALHQWLRRRPATP